MENIDTKEYINKEELLNTINKSTNTFNWLDFYNTKNNIKALIVITPTQKIILNPIYKHITGISLVYDLLYGINKKQSLIENTNNILIRLESGENMSINILFPKEINLYQDTEISNLIKKLQYSFNEIEYPDQFTEEIFKLTYEQSITKLKQVKVVDEINKNIIKDKYKI